jgi:phage replication-related protein YjqB (UPF0714/DUF867 family)
MADTYDDFADLAANETEGEDYRIRLTDRGSAVAIVAPHGGKIEPTSSEIAIALAGNDLSLYLFEGIDDSDNGRLHITSAHFDEPRALKLCAGATTVVGVHGRTDRGDPTRVWVGGRARMLRNVVTAALIEADFDAIAEGHTFPGEEPLNICNRGKCGAGVQLEIPRSLRDELRADGELMAAFVAAIRPVLTPAC